MYYIIVLFGNENLKDNAISVFGVRHFIQSAISSFNEILL